MTQTASDVNRTLARRITFDLFAAGNLSLMDELTAPQFINHGQTPGVPDEEGRASLANAIERVRAGFPDFRYELQHEVADGDFVVHHLTAHGTQTGPFACHGRLSDERQYRHQRLRAEAHTESPGNRLGPAPWRWQDSHVLPHLAPRASGRG